MTYMKAATAAVRYEKVGQYDQAALFWRRAEGAALIPVNQAWASLRAEVCEKRHVLLMVPAGR
ncbi:ANR family transcriptional regulator [Serratia rhizosphaerae]